MFRLATGQPWSLKISMAELAFSDLSYLLYSTYLCSKQKQYSYVHIFLSCFRGQIQTAGHVLVTMLIKVKTLTGKEIEIDIEPTDKVERVKVRLRAPSRALSLAS